jgi:NitT/TauT family transport system permease protein
LMGSCSLMTIWFLFGEFILRHSDYKHFSAFHPSDTFMAFKNLLFSDSFWLSVVASLRRIMVGLSISAIIGIPLGIVIGLYDKVWMATYFPNNFIRMVSPLSWMPIAIIIFQSFETSIYFLIVMSCIWPIILNTAQGVNRIDQDLLNMARNQGAKEHQLLSKIIVPSALPNMIIGLRLSLGIAWVVIVPAEFLGVSSGLGYAINDARDTFEYDKLLAIVFAIGFIGLVLDSAVQLFEKKYVIMGNAP